MYKQHSIGNKGEDLAMEFLKQKGYTILEQNWQFKRAEVDIIASLKNIIAFVEVKTKTRDDYGSAEEMFTEQQYHRIQAASEAYMETSANKKLLPRFDLVAIDLLKDQRYRIRHFEDVLL